MSLAEFGRDREKKGKGVKGAISKLLVVAAGKGGKGGGNEGGKNALPRQLQKPLALHGGGKKLRLWGLD